MKITQIFIVLFYLTVLSCKPQRQELDFYNNDFINNQNLSGMGKQDSIVYIRMRGRLERDAMLKSLREKNNSTLSFSSSKIKYVKAFPIECNSECYGSVFSKRMSQGVNIHLKDFLELINTFEKPNAFDNSVAACFDPQIGLVLYDTEGTPIGEMEICLGCNNIYTFPSSIKSIKDDTPFVGFSKKTRAKIREVLIPYGFNKLSITNEWDE